MVADRRAEMWRRQVSQPPFQGDRTYHDIRNGIRLVKDRERFAQRGPVHDLGIGERPVSTREGESCLFSDHPYTNQNQNLLDFKPVGRNDGCFRE